MMCNMDLVNKNGQMVQNMKDNTLKAKKVEQVHILGLMVHIIMVIGNKTNLMDMDNMFGVMAENMKENLEII